MASKSIDLGRPGHTREQDFRRFFAVLLFAMTVGVVALWGYTEGYITAMIKGMGMGFTVFFGGLLALGIGVSLREAWKASREINEIKHIGDDINLLKAKFNIRSFNPLAFEYVCREVERDITKRLSGLLFIYETSFNSGFFGTLVGLLIGLVPLANLTSFTSETLGPKMPMFIMGMELAFWSAIAGLVVALVARGMFFLLWRSTLTLQSRIERAFYNAMPG